MYRPTRREVLSTTSAVGVAVLAGCTGNGGGEASPTGTASPTESPTPAGTPTETGTPGGVEPADAIERWLTETEVGGADDSYDGSLADLTGQDTVTVRVGAEGNGGAFAFAPSAARVSVGTECQFEWTGEGGSHNVESLPEEQIGLSDYEFSSGEPESGEGVRYTRTLDTAGVLLAHCEPHLSLGMKLGFAVE